MWILFCMDLQKEEDSNVHGSGWMLVICKHGNWNWHWGWKYYIFLTKCGNTVWVTESTKWRDLLITWSRYKCKALYLHFCNTYGNQTWIISNWWWENPTFKVMWLFYYMVTWQMEKTYICTSTISIPMAIKLGKVVTYGQKTHTPSHVTFCSRGHVANVKIMSALLQYLWPPNWVEW